MSTTEPTPEVAIEELASVVLPAMPNHCCGPDDMADCPYDAHDADGIARAVLAAGYVKSQPFETGDRGFDRGSIVPTDEERARSRTELLEIFARQNQPSGELRKTVLAGTEQLSGALVDAIIDSGWENAELLALRENLATLLTRTANGLKGNPPKLTSWSWHDLPEVAAALRKQVGAVRELLATEIADVIEARVRAARGDVRCLDCNLRHDERQEYGCHESGRGHSFSEGDLVAAETTERSEPVEHVMLSVADLRAALGLAADS